MDQKEQIAHLAAFAHISKAEAGRILKELAKMIGVELMTSGRFHLINVGIFTLHQRAMRRVTIPLGPDKGKQKIVPAHVAVHFKPAKVLKDAVK